jgi:hypothetical protein
MKKSCASLKPLKTGVGSISQRNRSGDLDPDPHENVTVPNTGCIAFVIFVFLIRLFCTLLFLKRGLGHKN